ncbi:GNAT family N-acetyltransferase [Bacteroides sp. 214]|uniref:GNAT family N-acetyltransferase n=1 Tax=Bacteroides sp. 214 TaxID=2302935 RepID=UPI0013CF4FDA|nr:GNAT family N-acetyltransferase [Bacteroides sp. 214]NDW13133.1 GNAT family N-acetyltransferase [Bacteroides sp. 214]
MQIVCYTPEKREEWNQFIQSSRNGTFLLSREYIEYHGVRFPEHSLLCYKGNELMAVVPGNLAGNIYHTHQGLTYGGMIFSYQVTISHILKFFELILTHLKEEFKVEQLIYRAIPAIYHAYPAEEDLYALFRNKAELFERKLSTTILLEQTQPFKTLRERQIKRAAKSELRIHETTDITPFWHILSHLLQEKHNTTPVHSEAEMHHLMQLFPEEIKFFGVYDKKEMIAGTIVYDTKQVAHLQYIASNKKGKTLGALDFLFSYLIHERYAHKRYLDFGISVEESGWYLNKGLVSQKEGFGGRAIMYDTYRIRL